MKNIFYWNALTIWIEEIFKKLQLRIVPLILTLWPEMKKKQQKNICILSSSTPVKNTNSFINQSLVHVLRTGDLLCYVLILFIVGFFSNWQCICYMSQIITDLCGNKDWFDCINIDETLMNFVYCTSSGTSINNLEIFDKEEIISI